MKIKWHDKPQKHDYPAAASYLSLSMDQQAAKTVAEKLKNAEMTKFAAGHLLSGIAHKYSSKAPAA
jgi:hypothetical protein